MWCRLVVATIGDVVDAQIKGLFFLLSVAVSYAADHSAWRTLLASGQAPPDFRARPSPSAVLLALGRTSRSSGRTNAAIAVAACDDSLTARLGYVQRRPPLGDITNRM